VAWLLGIPALAACVGLTLAFFELRRAAAPEGHMLDVQKYGLVGLLTNGAVGADRVLGFLSGIASGVAAALAVLALIAVLWAVVIYLIGRGLARRAAWARVLGVMAAAGLLLVGLGALAIAPHRLALAPWPPIAAALYALWALIWRFASPSATPG
jgi:hypothetical protein